MKSFRVFIKSEKFVFTRARVSFWLFCLILIIGVYIEKKEFKTLNEIVKYTSISLIIFGVINSFFKRQLKGKLKGNLIFNSDNITINDKIYPLEEIKSIKINLNDYKGQYIGSINPAIFLENFSNGVNNEIIITLNTKEILKIYFQRETENEMISIHKFLRNYLDEGKLSRKNYDEITR